MKLLEYTSNRRKCSTLTQIIGGNVQEFSVLKKVGENYEVVSPPAYCRDYLQDIYACEYLNLFEAFSIYGMYYSKNNIFKEDKNYMYLGIFFDKKRVLNLSNLGVNITVDSLEHMLKKMAALFESREFKLDSSLLDIKHGSIKSGTVVVGIPVDCLQSPQKLSLVTLMLRNFYTLKEEDNLIKFLINSQTKGSNTDHSRFFTTALGDSLRLLKTLIILTVDPSFLDYREYKRDPKKTITSDDVHNSSGILGYLSTVDKEAFNNYFKKIEGFINKDLHEEYQKILPKS